MSYPYHLERFTTGYLTSQGALADRSLYGIVELVLEGPIEKVLGKGHLVFAFDYDAQREYPGSDYMTYGNSALEKIVQAAINNHHCALRYIKPADSPPANLEKKLASYIRSYVYEPKGSGSLDLFKNARQLHVIEKRPYWAYVIRFQFKISYLADEREETLLNIWMDGPTGIDLSAYATLKHVFSEELSPRLLPELPSLPYAKLFSQALNVLAKKAQIRQNELSLKTENSMKEDLQRTKAYFSSMLNDYSDRLSKAQSNASQQLACDLKVKLDNIELQKRHHMEDVMSRYQIRCETTLLDALCYVVPRWRLSVQTDSGRSPQRAKPFITLWWDELLKDFLVTNGQEADC